MEKPTLTVAVLGHVGHGKTTLTAAISKFLSGEYGLSRSVSVTEIEASERSAVECETPNKVFRLIDCQSHDEWMRALVTGTVRPDAALVVIDAEREWGPQTEEQIQRAKQLGIPSVTVFITKYDLVDDEDYLFVLELRVRSLLSTYGYDGKNCMIIFGSGLGVLEADDTYEWEESIRRLVEDLDNMPAPLSNEYAPLLMAVEDTFYLSQRGLAVTGRVERGTLFSGDHVDIVGLGSTKQWVATTGIEQFGGMLETALPGDNVGVLFKSLSRGDIQRGQVLATPSSIGEYTQFMALIYILTADEGGYRAPIFDGYYPYFHFRTEETRGFVKLMEGEMAFPGTVTAIDVELACPFALERGTRFAMRENGRTVAKGVVIEIPD